MALAGLVGLATTALGAFSAFSSSKKGDKGLEAQLAEMARIREENRKITEDTYSREKGVIDSLPTLESLLGKGGEIAQDQSQYLLDFVMGDTQDELRNSQQQNAKLANFDFSGLNTEIAKVLRSNQFDIVSMSGGEPIGSLANLSAQNVNSFAQQGLSNYLGISDFFARTGQVDRFNPYAVATDLYKIEEGKLNSKIGIEESRANRLTQSNQQWAASFADISNAKIANEANKYTGITNAISAGFSAYSGASALATNKATSNAQIGFYNAQTKALGY